MRRRTNAWPVILVLAFAVICVFGGVLAVVAMPFTRMSARSRASECKMNLEAVVTAQHAFMGEHDLFAATPLEAGFMPERGNRYAYVWNAHGPWVINGADSGLDAGGIAADPLRFPESNSEAMRGELPATLSEDLGLHGTCPECWFTAACVTNLDSDSMLDVWSISTHDRTIRGELVEAGRVFNHSNDLEKLR